MPARILICGGREWNDAETIQYVVDELVATYGDDISIIHGAARGADTLAGRAALNRHLVTVSVPAKWKKYDKKAGTIRNQFMLDRCKPELVIAFHEDLANSKGTGHMVRISLKANIPVIRISNEESAREAIHEFPEILR